MPSSSAQFSQVESAGNFPSAKLIEKFVKRAIRAPNAPDERQLRSLFAHATTSDLHMFWIPNFQLHIERICLPAARCRIGRRVSSK